jgi:hypothetical protein
VIMLIGFVGVVRLDIVRLMFAVLRSLGFDKRQAMTGKFYEPKRLSNK